MMYTNYPESRTTSSFMTKVYGWMAAALAITAATSWFAANNEAVFNFVFKTTGVVWVLVAVQFAFVLALSMFIQRLSYPAAIGCFIGYSILTGLTLSSIFYVYSFSSIMVAFSVTAGMFAFMALYGTLTKADLTGIGQLAFMGLIGLIIASVVNIFLRSGAMDYYISLFGVGIFTLLIAYDAQKIKQFGYALMGQGEMEQKVALLGALTLYLDFINLFLYLLRLLGSKNSRD
jgi:FtsH-binding integral membrane protein